MEVSKTKSSFYRRLYVAWLINSQSLATLKQGAMLINTGRGALVETPALIEALKNGQLGYLGLDVYEEEAQIFFEDRSDLPFKTTYWHAC